MLAKKLISSLALGLLLLAAPGLPAAKGPDWVQVALEAARLAPSAVNRQPWRFTVAGDSITVAVDNLQDTFNLPKRLDCGIAMLHIEVAALYYGVRGRWQFLDAPQVARFSWNGTVSAA
ncbi:hypothetical protein MOTE_17890 [Moorella thermoacetica]|uniref:Putative nitroreductase TM1586 domain-containing protein n=1 Tax=Neomoorella thermoacetica TaxID=1525 RepID=A0A1J5NHT2_NEOTH|nr:hypothetical protein MOTE_17890 [Moorella thermoacetica]